MRFIDPDQAKADVYTNFEDEIGEGQGEYKIVKADQKLKDYRTRVQRFLRDHRDHITIRRLRNNEPVTQKDMAALEDILFSEEGPVPREEYEKLFGDRPLGVDHAARDSHRYSRTSLVETIPLAEKCVQPLLLHLLESKNIALTRSLWQAG